VHRVCECLLCTGCISCTCSSIAPVVRLLVRHCAPHARTTVRSPWRVAYLCMSRPTPLGRCVLLTRAAVATSCVVPCPPSATCCLRYTTEQTPKRGTLEGTLQNVRQQLNGREVGGQSSLLFSTLDFSFVLSLTAVQCLQAAPQPGGALAGKRSCVGGSVSPPSSPSCFVPPLDLFGLLRFARAKPLQRKPVPPPVPVLLVTACLFRNNCGMCTWSSAL